MEQLQNIYTVTELNSKVKLLIEENFRFVHLIGEISNFKAHSQSGHYYFTLKDESSQIQSVMWRTRNQSLLFTPEDGMQVVIKGRLTVFGAKGSYQVEVWEMMPQGAGELRLRFEKLKQKLFDEGLFDESLKKPLPQYPQNIAILTSRTGAVIHDFTNIVKRRYPLVKIYLFPINVQGLKAHESIIQGLKDAEKLSKSGKIDKIDIIVLARGGGSLEDLWPFNEEKLARAIFDCKIPVVSAVGHEVDFTICDFVSDLRAPTPSAAAELITPNTNDLIVNIRNFLYFCSNFAENKLYSLRKSLKEVESNYYFNRPKDLVYNYFQRLDELSRLVTNVTNDKLRSLKNNLRLYKNTLHQVSPQNNLKKGYALVYKKQVNLDLFDDSGGNTKKSNLVTRALGVKKNDEVEIKFFDNKKSARITK
jgi:exodeoxyribonuclease VII large subunit